MHTCTCIYLPVYILVFHCSILFCRLKDAVPPTVNGSQQQSNTLDSRTPVYNPNYSRTPTGQPPSSQSNTLKKLTLDATSTSVYAEPRNTTIQTVPLPIPTESYNTSYPVNNPQRDSGIILPQLDTFLPPPETNPADLDVHIYAEPDEPGLNCQLGLQHEYAELEACVDRYRNSNKAPPQHHLGGPLPYEVPMVVGGSYVNVIDQELPSNSTGTHSAIPTEGSVECQTVTSPTVGTCDHQYATPGLPS